MEAIAAGASTLTFITVALKSAQTIYEIVSIIQNGPKQVEQLVSAVHNLQLVLIQLPNCRAIKSADSETNLDMISSLIKTCSTDVSLYER